MRRREALKLFGVAAAMLPAASRAQQAQRPRRIAVLMLYAENDPQGQARAAAFRHGLESAGWVTGRNIAIEYLWGVFSQDWLRSVTAELQRLAPDVIVVNSSAALRALQSSAGATPIVFIAVSEPVAQGFVTSLARPGGTMTGLSNLEPTIGAKWIGLLKEIAPRMTHVAFMSNPGNPGSRVGMQTAEAEAKRLGIEFTDAPVTSLADIETAIAKIAGKPDGALVVPPDPFTNVYRRQIADLARAHKLPVISAVRGLVDEGGLMTYGVSIPSLFRQAARYVDRILRGEKPADIPVEQPTKFEMIINLKTAAALGLTVPAALLASADEVIE